MNQLGQFIKWQFRDFGRMFKTITPTKVFVFLLGAQLGSIIIALGNNDKNTLDTLSLTIPLTVLFFVLSMIVEMQWDRFKRDQERVMNNLKVGQPPQQP